MIRIAQHLAPFAVRRYVPGIEFANCTMPPRWPVHDAQGVWPDGVDEVAGAAQKSFVDDEFIVAVFV